MPLFVNLKVKFDILKKSLGRKTITNVVMFAVGLVLFGIIVAVSVATLSAGKYTLAQWQDLFIFGLAQGSIYAQIALGCTLVYGVLRMINFAYSEVFMSRPYTAYFLRATFSTLAFLRRSQWLAY